MKRLLAMLTAMLLLPAAVAFAAEAPEVLIERLSNEVLERIRNDKDLQAGEFAKVSGFVDTIVMPHVDFKRMTALAVGRNWRSATPEQQQRLMNEFRVLLIRTYSGALSGAKDRSVRMKPMRSAPEDTQVIVRSQVIQPRADPVQLDYRLEKTDGAWKIYDVNVLGVWLVETYRNQFAQEVSAGGIDGLIKSLSEKNSASAPQSKS
jgi:phospholipid transport system substrate-binding protein